MGVNNLSIQEELRRIWDGDLGQRFEDSLDKRELKLASAIVVLRRIASFSNRFGPGDEAVIAQAWLDHYEKESNPHDT